MSKFTKDGYAYRYITKLNKKKTEEFDYLGST